jgi:ribonucleoside-diphosphate reductase alpha chain
MAQTREFFVRDAIQSTGKQNGELFPEINLTQAAAPAGTAPDMGPSYGRAEGADNTGQANDTTEDTSATSGTMGPGHEPDNEPALAPEAPVTERPGSGEESPRERAAEELTEPVLDENAVTVLERRYLKKDEEGAIVERPADMFLRVARNIAGVERSHDAAADIEGTARTFYNLMANLDFLPNSPTLMNAGRELQQLSACFVLPVGDSLRDIFETVKNTALIHQSGGGTGFSFSRLRPKNDIVKSTKGVSSGPVSFMTVFDAATEAIKQGGTRRGANMGILRIDHPDIEEFIHAKENLKRFNNFNISVALTEDFMQAVKSNTDYDLKNPRTGEFVEKKNAKKIFDEIVRMAHKSGEPGIIFIDRLNADNPTPAAGRIEATNPCGEQPLLPYESCNLGSINLAHMVKNGGVTDEGAVDFEKLGRVVDGAVHFLDNVIDANKYPLAEIDAMTKANRKIGLGVMGFAEMLIQMDIPYDSEEGLAAAEDVMSFIQARAREASIKLALARGSFPNFAGSTYATQDVRMMRNATTTTIAPTGTISIIAGASSGIEPIFALSFIRNVMDDDELVEVNKLFAARAKRDGFFSHDLMMKIAKKGTLAGIEEVPERIKRTFVTAHDIAPEWHIRMQAVFQKYTDNAVSKTVNFPEDATEDDIRRVYELAYELGCKGVTVYRDKSRQGQVLNIGEVNREGAAPQLELPMEGIAPLTVALTPRRRADVTRGTTRKMKTGCGDLYVTINEDEHGLFEAFAQMGKAGGCSASQNETTGRLISLAFRSGIDINSIIKQLSGIRCPSPFWHNGEQILSCSDAIAKALKLYIEESGRPEIKKLIGAEEPSRTFVTCPDCGAAMVHESGCVTCTSCGFSKC